MAYNESNNSFYSWEGTINRKDYVINMLILIALFFALNLVRFDILAQNKILYTILMFIIGFLKFIFIMSVLSVIYRRIADFSIGRSYKFQQNAKSLFVILFVFPVIYLYVLSAFFNYMPFINQILSFLSLCAGFLGVIFSIIFCFLKSK